MLIAFDHNDNRVHIDQTQSNQEYYCPYCGAPLVTRKGDVRQHHFAHKARHLCSDSWENSHTYDNSHWHNSWQDLFPAENQEIKVELGETKHRADVMIGKTVIEFQHSIMPVRAFDDRNNFYFNLGYKVIWLFDLRDIFAEGQMTYEKTENGLLFFWNNPKRAFNCYDVQSGCIDLFLQLKEDDENQIVRVKEVSEKGFASFETTDFMTQDAFLEYVGLSNGICPPPEREDITLNEQYNRFKEKYHISLNKQQERVLQAIEGHNLLLAVPGSGKTTVLVTRIGYMIIERGISPQNILALTYNKKAAVEMEDRFCNQFGEQYRNVVHFQTINSLSYEIYRNNCARFGRVEKKLIDDKQKRKYLAKVYSLNKPGDYPTEGDLIELESAFSYIKNMMLTDEEIKGTTVGNMPLEKLYADYQDLLKRDNVMDFDDQMVFAKYILSHDPSVATAYQEQYKYICVDEAQDTSKIQLDIIHILAEHNHLFMVGDEDQSIYGFRAAYPKALLNFRYDYNNPYILRMERNYRSTPEIVEAAQGFISRNRGRYEKNMTADRPSGAPIEAISVKTRSEQFANVLEAAKAATTETAFLYRDNDSSVVIVDLFLRNAIPFRLKKPEMNFFNHKVVKDIVSYLTLSLDEYDTVAFSNICNKGIVYIKKLQQKWTIKNSRDKHISIYDAYEEQMQYEQNKYKDRADDFKRTMNMVSKSPTQKAIAVLLDCGYENYVQKEQLDFGKIEILLQLAAQEPDKKRFLNRLTELENLYNNGFDSSRKNKIILSTIHSAKGLEYDTVYMVDVYDGRFPSAERNRQFHSKDNADADQEERRLFYVGVTRAKNKLLLYSIENRPSSYLDELLPERVRQRREAEWELQRQQREKEAKEREEREQRRLERERLAAIEKELTEKSDLLICQQEIMAIIDQQTEIARDHNGKRWVKCEKCGAVRLEAEFPVYGGPGHVNLGECYTCANAKRQ